MQIDWLIEHVNDRISRITLGPFFEHLGATRERSGLSWVHQLAHMSREFIQALLYRASRCGRREGHEGEVVFLSAFLEHAWAECRHPTELEQWARLFDLAGTAGRPAFCGVPKTPETERLLDHVWLIAEVGTAAEQVVVLNVVAEGVALAFYRAALVTLTKLDMNLGRYWRVHKDSDADHMLLGTDLVCADEGSDLGVRLLGLASVTLDLFEQMLTSWVPSEPLSTQVPPPSSSSSSSLGASP